MGMFLKIRFKQNELVQGIICLVIIYQLNIYCLFMTDQPFDLTNFIQLLQKNQKVRTSSSQQSRKNSIQSNRLSIIYSASEPESSMPDKQNSQISANKEIQMFSSEDAVSQLSAILVELQNSGLSKQQNQLLERAQNIAFDLMKNTDFYQKRIKSMQKQFEEERKGTDEIMQALMKMDEAEKQLWSSFNELAEKHKDLEIRYKQAIQENIQLQEKNHKNQENIEFMRKLVLIANQNYESLEIQFKQLQREAKIKKNFREQKSSPEITTRSICYRKKSYSPTTISQRLVLTGRKKSQFEQNYRRMILRTLKNKAHEK